MNLSHQKYFVTGTDTGIGKTYVTQQLMRSLKTQGKTVLGLKPVAAGGTDEGNEDALIYLEENSLPLPYPTINPYYFKEPISPHLASRLEGITLRADYIATTMMPALAQPVDHIFIEGAGGVHAPLSDQETMLDLMCAFNVPVILVVGLRLGCLNHAILSAKAIKSAGLTLAGVIPNPIDPNMLYQRENIETLEKIFDRI